MAVLNFPDASSQPTDGSFTYTENGITYQWYGYWTAASSPVDAVTEAEVNALIAAALVDYLQNSGDVSTGSITTPERTITTAFDMSEGPYWTAGAIDIPNPTNAVSGFSGIIRLTDIPTSWDTNFSTPPLISAVPAIVPFYVESSSSVRLGQAVEVA